jgi:hypothetical protein
MREGPIGSLVRATPVLGGYVSVFI